MDVWIDSLQLEVYVDELGQKIEFGLFDPIAVYIEIFSVWMIDQISFYTTKFIMCMYDYQIF